ncbi:MAG: M48 family metalloprotease [Candidatus Methanomethylophilaceae archaeon]|jgi:heat shock protein HtpX|nr:M48 family metalloprotease [Candidatus Methanomethylophilaceae archaeon]
MKVFWRLKTAMMFAFMTGLLVAIGIAVGYVFNNVWAGFYVMLALSIGINIYSYFCSKKMALAANKVHLITRDEEPRLYDIVESLAIRADLPMPEVGISEVPMPNAFATGRNPKNAAVVATRPLLDLLNDEELEGVMAHEMSHVKNRDILVMSVASTLASIISFVTRMGVYAAIFNSGNKNPAGLVILIIADIAAPIAAALIQLGVSRSREFLADESGGRLTGKPMALANALMKLEGGCTASASMSGSYDRDSYSSVWITNPSGTKIKSAISGLFRTHPSTEDRVAKLRELDAELRGY